MCVVGDVPKGIEEPKVTVLTTEGTMMNSADRVGALETRGRCDVNSVGLKLHLGKSQGGPGEVARDEPTLVKVEDASNIARDVAIAVREGTSHSRPWNVRLIE